MFKLERLIYAIAEKEGWTPQNTFENKTATISYRNHNPGNLRSSPFESGKAGGFSVFKTDIDGFNALKWDITQKAKGNTVTKLNGESTIRDLIFVYAPPEDNNNSEQYLKDIIKMTGLEESTKLKTLID